MQTETDRYASAWVTIPALHIEGDLLFRPAGEFCDLWKQVWLILNRLGLRLSYRRRLVWTFRRSSRRSLRQRIGGAQQVNHGDPQPIGEPGQGRGGSVGGPSLNPLQHEGREFVALKRAFLLRPALCLPQTAGVGCEVGQQRQVRWALVVLSSSRRLATHRGGDSRTTAGTVTPAAGGSRNSAI